MITNFFKSKSEKIGEEKNSETKSSAQVNAPITKKRKLVEEDVKGQSSSEEPKSRAEMNKQIAQERLKNKRLQVGLETKVTFDDLKASLHESWRTVLEPEFSKPYFLELQRFLQEEDMKATIYPPKQKIWAAFSACPFEEVRVVIIGQDPYHGDGQAEGLCFSVPHGVAIPSSLQNIYKELKNNIPGFSVPKHGHLSSWAQQGILLLNTGLTVRANQANSHKDKGWQTFTDAVISAISKRTQGVVFLLWGKHAQDKAKKIHSRHVQLKSPHPSGLSAHRGFIGNRHFVLCNEALVKLGQTPINWQI